MSITTVPNGYRLNNGYQKKKKKTYFTGMYPYDVTVKCHIPGQDLITCTDRSEAEKRDLVVMGVKSLSLIALRSVREKLL